MTSDQLPLSIAIVGHRDLRNEDIRTLEASVEATFRSVQEGATSTPLMLLCALAEGADRLVARIAYKMGISVVVPMPLERERYVAGFSSEASRVEFDELVLRADHHYVVPGASHSLESESEHFEHLIAYLVNNSQVLIALWDGETTNLAGGTAQAVQFKLDGVPARLDPARSPLDPADTGPVYHIRTPRVSRPSFAGIVGAVECMLPHSFGVSSEGATHARVLQHMNAFNRDVRDTLAAIPDTTRKRSEPLVPGPVLATLPEQLRHENQAFEHADALAQYYQRKTNAIINGFVGLAFVSFFFFEVYAYYFPETPWLMFLYVIPLIAAYGVYLIAKRRDYQNKYLDYRALAEGLRVQWFWHLGGIKDSVADLYLRKQRTELDWIRHAIRIWHVRVPTRDRGDERERMDHLLRYWINEQGRYYARAASRDNRRASVLIAWSDRLFLVGMCIAALHVGVQVLAATPPVYPVLMSMSMTLIIAGLMVVLLDKRGFVSQAKQFVRMTELFDRARPMIQSALDANDVGAARAVMIELGHETLVENGDWVMMHRERPLEVPKLG